MTQQTITFILELLFIQFLTVLIHELGHVIMLKICKVEIKVFRLFSKPDALFFNTKTTKYILGWIPFGGHVNPNPVQYYHLNKWAKVNILFSGVALNIITAYIAFMLYLFTGIFLLKLFFILSYAKILNLIPLSGSDGDRILQLYRINKKQKEYEQRNSK